MARTDSDKTVFLSLGFAEGELVARNFKQAARRRGFTFTDILKDADIVIGHSAGCYAINDSNADQTVILVGPPTLSKNTRTVLQQISQKLYYEYHQFGVILFSKKNLPNLLYAFNLPRNLKMRKVVLARQVPAQSVIFIRNKHDPFNTPGLEHHAANHHNYVSLPGNHDDIWINPDLYLDIMERAHE